MKTLKLNCICMLLMLVCSFVQGQGLDLTESMKDLGFVRSDVYYFRKMSEPWYSCGGKRCTPVMIVQLSDLKALAPVSKKELYKYIESEDFAWMLLFPDQLRWSLSASALVYLKGYKIAGKERMELIQKCEMAVGKVSVAGDENCQRLVTEAYVQLRETVKWAETDK